MSADAWVALAAGVALGLAAWWLLRGSERDLTDNRRVMNAYVRSVYEDAGERRYPHELADGTIRWYHVVYDDAMDV